MRFRSLKNRALKMNRLFFLIFLLSTPCFSEEQIIKSPNISDWYNDRPGIWRKLSPSELTHPYASTSTAVTTTAVQITPDFLPKSMTGFKVELFVSGLFGPRTIRVAPNGDLFIAETEAGRLRVIPRNDQYLAKIQERFFVTGLERPYGIAFYPPGQDPHYIYVSTEKTVIRYPYSNGDLVAKHSAEVIINDLPSGGHWTRDIAFSPSGKTFFLSIGSESNAAEDLRQISHEEVAKLEQEAGLGMIWGAEQGRAAVYTYDSNGRDKKTFATGLRNCSGLTMRPTSDELWCVVNERDMLGDNLPPDYATKVKEGGFYGWPWYYIGSNPDPRHMSQRQDLANQVTLPDVLFQAHSAPLSIVFYQQGHFPQEYWGDAFVTLHGSWNRAEKTGYKVVRVKFKDGNPTGEYQDFLTGFVKDNTHIWGRPAGVAVASDGSLLVSDDVSGSVWRVYYEKQ